MTGVAGRGSAGVPEGERVASSHAVGIRTDEQCRLKSLAQMWMSAKWDFSLIET